ncbi:MAG: biopolymer transporter ExbD [bacterium]|nr:biopolymer transporter ExbD [bacterium]
MEIELDPGRGKEEPMLFNLAPLIDCVFLLLIFFLLTSSFVERGFFRVDLPDARAASSGEREGTVITVERDGTLLLDGRRADPEAIRTALLAMPPREPERAVVVEADRRVRLETLVAVMDIVKECGMREISIETMTTAVGETE